MNHFRLCFLLEFFPFSYTQDLKNAHLLKLTLNSFQLIHVLTYVYLSIPNKISVTLLMITKQLVRFSLHSR